MGCLVTEFRVKMITGLKGFDLAGSLASVREKNTPKLEVRFLKAKNLLHVLRVPRPQTL